MATKRKRLRVVSIEVTGGAPSEVAQLMSIAVDFAKEMTRSQGDATITLSGTFAKATITVTKGGA